MTSIRTPGEMVREARDAAGYTQSLFASMVGISQANLSQIEQGQRGINPELRGRIVTALEIDPTQFMIAAAKAYGSVSITLAELTRFRLAA